MQTVILPLLISFFYAFAHPTAAMEGSSNTDDNHGSHTRMSASPAIGGQSNGSVREEPPFLIANIREQEELFLRQFFPTNPRKQIELAIALEDKAWDPEAPLNLENEILLAKFASRLQAAIDRDPVLRGSNPPALLISSLPLASAPPIAHHEPAVAADAIDMPVFDNEKYINEGIGGQICRFAAQVYLDLSKKAGGIRDITTERVTGALLEYSLAHSKGWPVELLQRVAGIIVEADDDFAPGQQPKDASGTSSSGK
jgi:hypothetical protein